MQQERIESEGIAMCKKIEEDHVGIIGTVYEVGRFTGETFLILASTPEEAIAIYRASTNAKSGPLPSYLRFLGDLRSHTGNGSGL